MKDHTDQKANYYVNDLKARSTKRVEIPVILSKKVVDPKTHKIIFDTYKGAISSTFEFRKSELA